MSVNNVSRSADPMVDSVLQSVQDPVAQPAKTPGKFRKVMGTVAGVAGSALLPGGVGGAIGNIIMGGGMGGLIGSSNLLGGQASQFLRFQQQMLKEQQQFELASTVLKNRHDAAMSAIRNMKAS
jgi:hypothetical protein